MIKFRMYSKIYDKAKAQHDRSEDYEIAEIAKEQSKLKGQIIGAGIGLGISALSKKKLGKLIEKNPKLVEKVRRIDPGILDAINSGVAPLAATLAGSHYGGEITGNAAKKLVLQEIEDKRSSNKKRKIIYDKI
jgi:hypothetical protein